MVEKVVQPARLLIRGLRAVAIFAGLAFGASAFGAVGVNKSFNPISVSAGQVSTLTIVLLNPNAAAATATALTDTLPANVVVANPLTVGVNTCGFAVNATPGLQPIVLSGGTIPGITGGNPGQCTLTINVVSSIPNTYLNTISAGAVTSSEGTNAQNARATLVVSAPANITASKAFVPTIVHGNGTSSTLTITLTNPNPIPLTNAAITDTLPATLAVATGIAVTTCNGVTPGTATTTAPATIALTGGTIPANASCTITVSVSARTPNTATNATATNSVAAGALTTLQGATSPAFSANITVQTGGALTKQFLVNPVRPGGASTLRITVSNFNQSILTPITFTDTWTPAANMVAVPGTATTTCSGTVTNTVNSVTLTGASLAAAPAAAGATTCTIDVPVTGNITTNNSIAAGNWGGVAYSATGTVTLTVSSVTGSKAFSTPALQGGSTTTTITLNNTTPAAATITSVTDNLLSTMGAGFTQGTGATVSGTCGTSLTSAPGATTLTFAGGTIPANGNCTIILNAIAIAGTATSGNHTNTIATNGVVTSAGNNLATLTGTVNVTRVLSAAKAFSPATIQAGARSRLTVTLSRAANAPALTNLAFIDNLTTMGGLGFVVATPANATTTCGGPVTANPGANNFSLAGGGLSGGAAANSCTVAVDVQSPAGQAAGTYTNTLAANAVTSTEGFTNLAATANLVISAPTSVTINKSFSPTIVAVNGTSTMSVQIRNNNAAAIALTGVALTDALPSGMVIANPPAPTFTGTGCSGATITAVNNSGTVAISGANVGINSICILSVTVRAQTAGNLINVLPPNSVTSLQGVTNPLTAAATLAAIGTVNLNVTKNNPATSLTPGGTTTWTIGVSNSGPNDVAGVVVNDTPPPGVTFGAWTCVPTGAAICGSGTGPISDTVTIPNGASITYTVPASIAPSLTGASVTNTATLTVPGSVINNGNTTASNTKPVVPVTSLALTKDDGSPTYRPGTTATYTIVVTNGGPSDATSVNLNDTFPAGVTQNGGISCGAVGPGAACGTFGNLGTGFTVTGAYVPASGGSQLIYTVPVNFGVGMTAPSITNTVNAINTASAGPGSTANASDTNTLLLFAPTLGKTFLPPTIGVGGTSTLSLLVGNTNAAPLTLTAPLVDNMPAGVTISGGNTGTCTGVTTSATQISWGTGSTIPAGGCTIVVTVTSATPGAAANVTGSLLSTGGTAPPASATLTVNAAAPNVAKSFTPATITTGGTSSLTITLGNPNASATTLTAPFTDVMPAGVTIVGATGGSCTGVSNTTTTITMAAGSTLPPTLGCTITATVTSSTPGPVTNTTSTLATGFGTGAPASAVLTVDAAGPTLAKAIAPATIVSGGTSTLTLTLGNPNTSALTLTAPFTDAMPAGVTIAAGNSGTCAGVSNTATTVTMASGSAIPGTTGCTIVVAITSTTPGTVTNTTGTVVTAAGTAPAASAPLTVTAAAPTLAKSIVPGTITAGGSTTLTLALGNPNATPLTLTAPLTDTMPAGVTITTGNSGTCTGVSNTPTTITMASGSPVASGGCTIVVAITSSTPGTVTNTTGALTTDGGAAPAASAPLTVTAVGPTLAKSILPATIASGGTTTLTVTLGNPNTTALALTAPLTDTMPAGVTIVGATSGTCTGVSNTPTTITMASGSAIPGTTGCTIVATVTSSTPGGVTNTTSTLQTAAGTAPAASAPLTVTAVAPTLAKSIAPGTITAGGTTTLTLTLGNPNATPLTLTAPFTDTMPAGVTIAGAAAGSCTGVSNTPTTITMASGSAIPGTTGCTITATITSATPGTVTNTTGSLVTGAGTAPPASAPLVVNAALPTLAKAIGPGTITAGGTTTLTLTLGNPNTTPLTLTAPFTDTMPAGVTIAGATAGSCTGVSNTPTTITMASGSAIPGTTGCTITATITSATPGTVTNTTSALTTGAGAAPPASAPLVVNAAAPTLAKSIAPGTIIAGGTSTLTLTLGNPNTTPLALTAPFTDAMPAGVTIVGATGGSCAGVSNTTTTITMASGSAIPGTTGCTITATITSATPGTVTNTTSTAATAAGSAPAASAPLTVTAAPPTLAKAIAPAAITAGGTSTLTLTLGNPNTTPLTLTAPFTDTMPAGVTLVGATGGSCVGVSNTTTTITMASGSVIPGTTGCTITATITSATPGTVTNTTSTVATVAGSAPAASAPLTVNAAAPTLVKGIAPATITAGGTATLTLTLGNPNATPLTLTASFTDTMPAGVTISAGNTGTCVGVSNTPTTVTMASGSTIPGTTGCTIVVTITSTTPGTVTNTTGTLATGAGTAPAASAPLTVNAGVPTLAKGIAPATIGAGGTATLTLTLGNPNATPITLSSAFTDTMPAGVTIMAGNSGTCTGVSNTATTVTMAPGSAIPGTTGCTIVVTITSSTPGTVTNTTSALQTSAGTAPSASAPLTVTVVAPTLAKAILPATITSGGNAALTLTLGNPNAAPLTLTAPFTDSMPAGVTITSGNVGTCTGVSNTATTVTMASGSTLPATTGCTIVVAITSSTPGTVTNTTSSLVTAAGTAPAASAPLTVTAVGPTLSKAFAPATISVGGTSTLTLRLSNPNAAPLTLTAPFIDTMPAGITIVGAAGGSCPGVTATATTVTMASGSAIPAAPGCIITVQVRAAIPGTALNTTGPLFTDGGSAPPATSTAFVNFAGPPSEIPALRDGVLALLALLLLASGVRRIRRRG